MLRDLPRASWDALGWFGNIVFIALAVLFLVNRPLASAVSSWHGISPWWAVVPFAVLIVIGLAAANYRRYAALYDRLDQLRKQSNAPRTPLPFIKAGQDATENTVFGATPADFPGGFIDAGRDASGNETRAEPVIPLPPPPPPRQLTQDEQREAEIELGHRAISVGTDTLTAYGEARVSLDTNHTHTPQEYQAALQSIKDKIGGAWQELVTDLQAFGLLHRGLSDPPREISVNYNGLDSQATTAQAIGRALLRKHGVNPDAPLQSN